jgi:hypothetical protein
VSYARVEYVPIVTIVNQYVLDAAKQIQVVEAVNLAAFMKETLFATRLEETVSTFGAAMTTLVMDVMTVLLTAHG